MKNATEKMLQKICIGAESGCEAVNGILSRTESAEIRRQSAAQLETYCAIRRRAEEMLEQNSMTRPSFSWIDRMSVRGGILAESLTVSTEEDLARLKQRISADRAGQMRKTVQDLSTQGCDSEALALGMRMAAFDAREAAQSGVYGNTTV